MRARKHPRNRGCGCCCCSGVESEPPVDRSGVYEQLERIERRLAALEDER